VKAGKLMVRYSLGYSDLPSLQTMKSHVIKEIYSSDSGLDAVPEIRRVFAQLREEDGYKEFLDLHKTTRWAA
jgi:predicted nucleic acid-binding protein